MESINVIKYKWQNGVYDLKDMIILVKKNMLNEQQFFNITRYKYQSVKDNNKYIKEDRDKIQ